MEKFTYKQAGVDIDKANRLITKTRELINSTKTKGTLGSVGGFSGFFDLSTDKMSQPVLAASTDGVGTKLKIAQLVDKHDTIGIDLVAMCVNDIICSGARPLFFLDYIATGKLKEKVWTDIIKGIVKGCRQSHCVLLGGETAEMPGMYKKDEYDLAGFAVGVIDRKKIIDGKKIKYGDVMLGIASSGLHSNGYSLVRKILSKKEMRYYQKELLEPTLIYTVPFLELSKALVIKGAAHITGGGFYDNIPRMFPAKVTAVIYKDRWTAPRIFHVLSKKADIKQEELYRTFNMGIGLVLAVSGKDADKAKRMLKKKFNLESWIIGDIVAGNGPVEIK